MTYVFYIFISLVFIVAQTIIFPLFPVLNNFFDLLLTIIVYAGFFLSVREGIFIVVFIGITLDGISGVSFGRFLSAYLWLFIASQWLKQFLQVNNYFFLSCVMVLGVLIEAAVLIMGGFISACWNTLKIIMFQLIFAAAVGPLTIRLIGFFNKKWEKIWRGIISAENNDFF